MEQDYGIRSRNIIAATLAHSTLFLAAPALAQTWSATPTSSDWNTAANWTPAIVPNSSAATAEFGAPGFEVITLEDAITLDTLRLAADTSGYRFEIGNNGRLLLSGAGIENLSAETPQVTVATGGELWFDATATAANAFIFNDAAVVQFFGSSTAADAEVITVSGALTQFANNSSAGNARLMTQLGAITEFLDFATAESARVETQADGTTYFRENATAGSAMVTTHSGGTLAFTESATAGNARIFTDAGGVFSIEGLTSAGLTAGSIEGFGEYRLGSRNLEVGSLNSDTNVGGAISGSGGSLTKVGSGTLTLIGVNTYSGGTTIAGGTIAVFSDANLGDAAGTITFDGGTLRTLSAMATARDVILEAGGGTIRNGNAVTLSGSISGTGGLVKTGAGLLTLTGTNSYSGGTTVAAGYLRGNSASLQGDIYLASNTELTFDQVTDGTYAGDMSGAGMLIKEGDGTLTITGVSTRTGTTRIREGELEVAGGQIIGAASISVASSAGDHGTLHVTGSTSRVETTGLNNLTVGASGTGTLLIENGGFVRNAIGVIGSSSGSAGAAIVSGAGSQWTNASGLVVGSQGTGTLTIANGGSVSNPFGAIGLGSSSVGSAIVSGVGSQWVSAGMLNVGSSGEGTLTITDGAQVSATVVSLGVAAGSSGTLNIGAGGAAGILTTGSVRGVTEDTTLNLNHTDAAYTLGANLGLLLEVNQIGNGTTILTGNNTHLGGTNIAAGTLAISTDANLGNVSGGLTFNGGTLRTDAALTSARNVTIGTGGGSIDTNGFDVTFSNVIAGTGGLTKTGEGTLTLSGTNTYAGGTRLSAGTLAISADASLGAGAGWLAFDGGTLRSTSTFEIARVATLGMDGGGVDVAANSTLTYSGAISGSGELRKLGDGTLILNGANGYTGGLTITAGTLQSDTTSLRGNVRNDARLVFAQETDGAFYGAISGTGTLTKRGTGTLTLNGANTYTGPTLVDRGALFVNGSLASAVTVGSRARLGGSGRINNDVLVAGTLAPGNGIGTLTVNGALTMAEGSRLVIEANAGNADRVDVIGPNGVARIDGSTMRVEAAGNDYRRNTTYTVLTAQGGVNGSFDAVSSNLAFLTPSLSYDANAVYLTLRRNDVLFSDVATTPNQHAVADYLDDAVNDDGVEDLIRGMDSLTAQEARSAFVSIGGEGLSSLARASIANTSRAHEMISTRLGTGGEDSTAFGTVRGPAGTEDLTAGAWARVIGARGDNADSEEVSGYSWDVTGTAAGVERKLGSRMLVGASAMHTRTEVAFGVHHSGSASITTPSDLVYNNYTIPGGEERGHRNGSGTITTPQALVYSSYTISGRPDRDHRASRHAQLRGSVGYARHEYETNRPVEVGAFASEAHASHEAQELSAQGEVELVQSLGDFRLQTLFGLRYIRLDESGYTESGSPAALTVDDVMLESVAAIVGTRLVRPFFADRGALELRAQWSRELNETEPTLTAGLANVSGGARFSVSSVPAFPDTFTVGTSVSARVHQSMFLYADYKAELWGGGRDQHSVIAGFSYLW